MNAPVGTCGFTVLVTYLTTGFVLRTMILVFGTDGPRVVTVLTTVAWPLAG